jgi:ribosomal protein L11 methyltransferase
MLRGLAAAGLAEDQPAPGQVRLRCYALPSQVRAETLRSLRDRVRGLSRWGLDPGPASVTRRAVTSRPWVRAWRTAVRPMRIGRLVVAPTRCRVPRRPHDLVIRIDPGMAFGSGAHPSTRLCLRALVRLLRAANGRPAVLDIGTGSGILAIAAARLGAGRVWARDIDPVAVAIARRNVRRNGVARIIRVVRGAGVGRPRLRLHVIVANIVAETIAALLPDVRASLAAGGVFIGSGIVDDRLDDVLRAGAAAGLTPAGVLVSGEWRAVVLASPSESVSTLQQRGERGKRGTPPLHFFPQTVQ